MAGPVPLRAIKPPQAPTLERQIEARLVKRVEELGGEVRKVAWIGRRGAPDRLVMLPDRTNRTTVAEAKAFAEKYDIGVIQAMRELKGPPRPARTIWVELKAPGKARTFPTGAHEKAQHREHERMRKMGQRVEVIDSYEQIEELLKC